MPPAPTGDVTAPPTTELMNEAAEGTAVKPLRTSLFASYSRSGGRGNEQQSSASLSALVTSYLDAVAMCRVCNWDDIELEGYS
jgi:hypothetical protein